MRWLLFFALVGCAEAGQASLGQRNSDGGIRVVDSGSGGRVIDAFVRVDGPGSGSGTGPTPTTLDQNTSDTPVEDTGIACGNASGTQANSFYRVFDLGALGITSTFSVTSVSFGVEDYEGNIQVTASVGTYTGTAGGTTLNGMFSSVAGPQTATIPQTAEGDNNTVAVPVTASIPGGSKLYVEINAPAGGNGNFFYIGSNTAGESSPGYLKDSQCGQTKPTSISSLGTTSNAIITVTGTY